MRRCVACRARPRACVYQPWPPPGGFAAPGRHLTGYPVVSLCDPCAGGLRVGLPLDLVWFGRRWTAADGTFMLSEHREEKP